MGVGGRRNGFVCFVLVMRFSGIYYGVAWTALEEGWGILYIYGCNVEFSEPDIQVRKIR